MDIFSIMAKKGIKRLEVRPSEPTPAIKNASNYPKLIRAMKKMGHKKIVFFYHRPSNLRAMIAIHSTKRGPALGGFRQWAYKTEWDAVNDALRLSRGMTYKSAAVDFPLGGGKAVSWLDERGKTKPKLKAFANALVSMENEFITGEDIGTTEEDVDFMYDTLKKKITPAPLICFSKKKGSSGDPSAFTAMGIVEGMRFCVQYTLKKRSLKGLTVALQGTGNVGGRVGKMLLDEGAKLYLADPNQKHVDALLAYAKRKKGWSQQVALDEIYGVKADVFCPCALGAILNKRTIPKLKVKIIAGSANNQLEDEHRDGDAVRKRRILYAPDYILNAGGLINAGIEALDKRTHHRYSVAQVLKTLKLIPKNLKNVFDYAKRKRISPARAANILTEERLHR